MTGIFPSPLLQGNLFVLQHGGLLSVLMITAALQFVERVSFCRRRIIWQNLVLSQPTCHLTKCLSLRKRLHCHRGIVITAACAALRCLRPTRLFRMTRQAMQKAESRSKSGDGLGSIPKSPTALPCSLTLTCRHGWLRRAARQSQRRQPKLLQRRRQSSIPIPSTAPSASVRLGSSAGRDPSARVALGSPRHLRYTASASTLWSSPTAHDSLVWTV